MMSGCVGIVHFDTHCILSPPLRRVSWIILTSEKKFEYFLNVQAYAASFFVIPAVRMVLNMQRNAALKAANQNRLERLREVRNPEPALQRKLLSAQKQAKRKVIR